MTLRTRVSSRAYACVLSAFLATAGAAVPARADVLTVTASGTIGSSCGLTSASPVGSPNLSASGSVGATVTVNCNTGFRLNALSAQGAIKSATSAPANFSNNVPYSLTVSVPLETGGPASATCASSTLATGQSSCALSPGNTTGLSSSGKASLNKTASLTFAYTVPALPTRLIAGTYSDTVTLTITVAP